MANKSSHPNKDIGAADSADHTPGPGLWHARGASEELSPHARPSAKDLVESLRFNADDGRIWLNGERMVLNHTSSIGAMRHELIESMGFTKARGMLLRMGYHSGARDAALVRRQFPEADALTVFAAGPRMHSLEGAVLVEPVRYEFDTRRGTFYGEYLWHHSYEDDEHIARYGIGTEAACWIQTGYAMGYTSAVVGRLVLYREVECRAMGADTCRIIGRPAEEWPNPEQEMAHLNAEQFLTWPSKPRDAPGRTSDKRAKAGARGAPAAPAAGDMVGISAVFNAACHQLRRVAPTQATVLLSGESGVGKEVFAQMLHRISGRHDAPFVALNCAAIPETLIESELFGVEKNAYTGAGQSRAGRFERANKGTLFLDEIATLSLIAQGKLLRALQESEIERLGGERTIRVDARVVVATNVDLREAVRRGEFREDLFFRLNVFPIRIPPLRDRRDDIPLLMSHFLHRYTERHGKPISGFTPGAVKMLLLHPYPGNIRELQNLIERGVIAADANGAIDVPHLLEYAPAPLETADTTHPAQLAATAPNATGAPVQDGTGRDGWLEASVGAPATARSSLREIEGALIAKVLSETDGNVSEAARRLGLTRAQLTYRLASAKRQAASR